MTGFPATFRAPVRRAGERVPVTLVTGFLGSGKTTLVNRILANRQGVRAAVLVNELGDIAIDNDLIIAGGDDMIALGNGCICCSVNGDLVDGIARVLSRADPVDHIVVETTGVADPLPVARTFLRIEFRSAVRLDAIVAMVDAEHFSLELFDGPAARNQIRHADAILVNKVDRIGVERRDAVEAGVRALNPQARIVHTIRGDVSLPLILDVDLFRGGLQCEAADGHSASDGFLRCRLKARARSRSRSSRRSWIAAGPRGCSVARACCAWPRPGSATSSTWSAIVVRWRRMTVPIVAPAAWF